MKTYLRPLAKPTAQVTKKALGKKYNQVIGRIGIEWPHIVGPYLAERAFPLDIKMRKTAKGLNGTLVLGVNSAFAPEIQYARIQIIERINSFLGHNLITDIRITDAGNSDINSTTRLHKIPEKMIAPLPADKQNKMNTLLKQIEDPDLRHALSAFGKALWSDG